MRNFVESCRLSNRSFLEELCATLSYIFSMSLVWAWIEEESDIIESDEEGEGDFCLDRLGCIY